MCTLTDCLLKVCISRVRIMGQISMNSWFKVISERRRIRILKAKRIRIKRAAWAVSGFLMTSTILASSTFNRWAYRSRDPEYKMKQILSKLLILLLFSADSLLK